MKTLKTTLVIAVSVLLSSMTFANSKSLRASEMSAAAWSEFTKGKLGDIVIEFRQGDELPVTFQAEGDLIETKQTSVSYVGVKKNFWLRLGKNDIEISLDGTEFKKLNQMIAGSLQAGAGTDQNGGVANAVNVVLKAFLK